MKTIEAAAREYAANVSGTHKDTASSNFKAGAEFMNQQYEEKLRWNKLGEKFPDQLEYIELKDSCDRIYIGFLSFENEFRERLTNNRIHFVVSWRQIPLK